ncbi:MAG: DUF547 domain-containing protein [Chloroherpetonaceae bacterium]
MTIWLALLLLSSTPSFDHARFNEVLKTHVKNGRVDYKAVGIDENFKSYIAALQHANPNALTTREEKLAFWINAYNAITINFITKNPTIKSIRDITPNVWKEQTFSIGGKPYTLDEIEHKIIIGELNEIRAHFVLVCAAKSCPPLRSQAYTPSKVSKQIDEQAKAFLNNPQRNRFDAATKTLHLAKIFEWFKDDFTKVSGSVQKFIEPYLAKESDRALLMQSDVRIEYLDYDWSLND